MNYVVYYDDKLRYYRIMQPAFRYRANETPILKTTNYKIAKKVTVDLNEEMLKHEF
nr:MAG TPA: hypothetical protein [Caudoviricetes sp.]